jgi:hypothetical protein
MERFFEHSLEIIDKYKQLTIKKEELSESEFLGRAREIFGEYNTEKFLVGRSFIDVIAVVNKSLGQDLYMLCRSCLMVYCFCTCRTILFR